MNDQLTIQAPEKPVSPAAQPEQTAAPTPEPQLSYSPSIGSLIEALAKASLDFKPVLKNSKNPFYKSNYADLAEVIDATRNALGANGLAVLQPAIYKRESGVVEIQTILAHSSGQWMKSLLEMPMSKQDAQGIGSAITYGRRYAYSAMLNVASEEDDDGNAAVSKPFKKEETEVQFDQRTEDQQNLKTFEITAIDEACKRTGKTEDEVVAYLGLLGEKRIEHLKRGQFKSFLQWANSKTEPKKTTAALKPASQIPAPDQAQKVMKRLFATANEYQIPEGDVKTCAYERYKVDSMTKLTVPQLEDMIVWVKEVAAAVRESS